MMNKSEIINTNDGDLYVLTNGEVHITCPQNSTSYSLEEMQGIVEGWIEPIYSYKSNEVLVVNEEGMLKGLPINKKATEWFRKNDAFGKGFIYGNALLTTNDKIY